MSVSKFKAGTWPHWFQPEYKIAQRLAEKQLCSITEIDFHKKGYLDHLDIVIIEQNGFDDYLENDALYLQEFVRRGGICWIMHQDAARWSAHVLPEELGEPFLITRYLETVSPAHRSYLMPGITPEGQVLFQSPNKISSEEMAYWKLPAQSFGINAYHSAPEWIESTALSAVLNAKSWEVLGKFRDAAVPDGALILQAKYGNGLFFWTQILFPEEKRNECAREFAFWDRFSENVLHYFALFREGNFRAESNQKTRASLPAKGCYRMLAHLHSLDWFAADTPTWTIAAAMKYLKFDIGILSVKDALSCGEPEQSSDEKALLLAGQEFHPFNFLDQQNTHNAFHILAMGTDSFSKKFTKAFYSTEEIDTYLREAIRFIHENGGAAAATHPDTDYWKHYDFDAVDISPKTTLSGSAVEKFYMEGGRITMITSVDMWGLRRLRENPVFCFLYQEGSPNRNSVVHAIRSGHLIPAFNMKAAEITLNSLLPGDTLSPEDARKGILHITAESENALRELRVYSGASVVYRETLRSHRVKKELPLSGCEWKTFLRVEIEGDDAMLISNPFYLLK